MAITATTPANRTRTNQYGETTEILTLERVGERGWAWTTRVTRDADDVIEYSRETNGAGRGLWEGDRQISGTAQFALPATRAAALRQLLRSEG